jgi:hypothetical protein
MGSDYPELPASKLESGGWEQRVRTESTVFRMPTASVVGRTVLYEDAELAAALSAAGAADLLARRGEEGGDRLVDTDGTYWRFFFATALSFRPPLAPGVGPASMRPTVVAEARSSFADDLRARGFEDVERGRTQRARTEGGDRVSLSKVTASYPFEDEAYDPLDVEGWLGVWSTGGEFRIAGGAYPRRGLDQLLASLPDAERPEVDPNGYRDELLDLLRGVA